MSNKKKRTEELDLARSFQSHVPSLAGYGLDNADPPEPDIVATKAQASIGIELTQMRGLSLLSVREAERTRVLERASALVRERTGACTAVRVDWRPGTQFDKDHRESLAEELAQFVARHLPADEGSVLFGPLGIAAKKSDDPALLFVYILRADVVGENEWVSDYNWPGSLAQPPFVQAHIARKDTKPAKYLGKYDERWLLLIHEGYKPSSGYGLSDDVRTTRFSSTYDRVFVYSLMPVVVIELIIAGRVGAV